MLIVFIVSVTVIVIFLARIYARKWWRNRGLSKEDQMLDKVDVSPALKNLQDMYNRQKSVNMAGSGTDRDTIPEGFGAFGLESTNPIPVNTLFGSLDYLKRLRTMDGKVVQNNRIGSIEAANIEMPIDVYEISVGGKFIANIFVSPYHKKNSERGPAGFMLAPQVSDDVFFQ